MAIGLSFGRIDCDEDRHSRGVIEEPRESAVHYYRVQTGIHLTNRTRLHWLCSKFKVFWWPFLIAFGPPVFELLIDGIEEETHTPIIVFVFAPFLTAWEYLLSDNHVLIKGHLHIIIPSNWMALSFYCTNKLYHHVLAIRITVRIVHFIFDKHLLVWEIEVPVEEYFAHIDALAAAGKHTENLRLSLLHEVRPRIERLLRNKYSLLEFAKRASLKRRFFKLYQQLVFCVQE